MTVHVTWTYLTKHDGVLHAKKGLAEHVCHAFPLHPYYGYVRSKSCQVCLNWLSLK